VSEPDILAALATAEPGSAGHRCKVGRWLDSLADQPGHDQLVAAFETPNPEKGRMPAGGRSLAQLCAIAARLGCQTSDKTVGEHRNRVCRCLW
jgi:hypothetical protein